LLESDLFVDVFCFDVVDFLVNLLSFSTGDFLPMSAEDTEESESDCEVEGDGGCFVGVGFFVDCFFSCFLRAGFFLKTGVCSCLMLILTLFGLEMLGVVAVLFDFEDILAFGCGFVFFCSFCICQRIGFTPSMYK